MRTATLTQAEDVATRAHELNSMLKAVVEHLDAVLFRVSEETYEVTLDAAEDAIYEAAAVGCTDVERAGSALDAAYRTIHELEQETT